MSKLSQSSLLHSFTVLSCPSELSEVRQQTGVTYSGASSCWSPPQSGTVISFSLGSESHSGTLAHRLRAGWAQPRGTCHQLCALAGLCAMGEHQLVAHTARGALTQPRYASKEFSSSQRTSMELCSAQAQAVSPLLFVLGGSTMFPRAAVQAGRVCRT